MTTRRLSLLVAVGLLALLGAAVAAPAASAAPVWNLNLHHNETNFPPGGEAEYWVDVANVGDTDSSGPVTLTVFLPGGLSRKSIRIEEQGVPPGGAVAWACPGSPGQVTVTCTTNDPIRRHSLVHNVMLRVSVNPAASGERFASASVSGGGAAKSASAVERTVISSTPAGFGIVADSFLADFLAADAVTPERQASSHPENLTVAFDFNTIAAPPTTEGNPIKAPNEPIKGLRLDLPPGFVGAPTAVGECTAAQLSVGTCPRSSQVGRADVTVSRTTLNVFTGIRTGLYNMVHPRGTITDLAFQFSGIPVHIKASLDPARRYGVAITVSDINETLPAYHSKVTTWGVPGDSSHDSERCGGFAIDTTALCPTGADPKPFLTMPAQCDQDTAIRLHHYDSWDHPGAYGPDLVYPLGKFTGCDRPRFEPEVEIVPTGRQANTPTGVEVSLHVPQNESPVATATPPVKSTVVTFPSGMTLNPAFADGLDGCSLAQIGLGTDDPVACPDNSRIGEVSIGTPVLPKPLEGSMYLAEQRENPFGTTFAMYMAVQDTEERGVLVKIPGRIDLDQTTGQITATFDELPQLPFEDFTLSFRSGQRAPLVNPQTCGSHEIGIEVTSYAEPDEVVDASSSYQINEGPSGGACPPGAASRPFGPRMNAGTINPAAGQYSPFAFRLERTDADQELSQVTTILPPGLVAKLAGISYCPEATIASISTAEGTGSGESVSPSCPAASRVGTLDTGVGAGTSPNYFRGSVFLAGPYKGAPLSLAIVVPALAGPFDFGNVVVRAALQIDPATAQVKAVSDPFPTILHGVLLRIRDVRLQIDRPQTTLNPTSCEPMAVSGGATGVGGDLLSTADDSSSSLSSRFQVLGCADLGFEPQLSLRLLGGTRRGAHPRLKAVLRARPGDANIARASVALPHSEFLDQNHIRTICTRVQFAADACPAGSVYGTATARTPLLDEPLSGPVYLRSSDNPLPDLVAVLGGQIEVHLVGRIDSVNEGIRNTFDVVPDAPVSSFVLEMQGGKKGLLVNSTNLCGRSHRATAKFSAQNGKAITLRPALKPDCKKAKRGAAKPSRGR